MRAKSVAVPNERMSLRAEGAAIPVGVFLGIASSLTLLAMTEKGAPLKDRKVFGHPRAGSGIKVRADDDYFPMGD